YLAYLCGEDVVLPIPDGNAERYLAYLCGMDVTRPDVPDGRTETYLAYKCGEDVVLPDPMYRIEYYLAKWCGIDCEVPEPLYRIEYWLAQLANSGELKTVTGNPISVSDALAKPAESLVIEILPQQSGSGDPSPDNVRPIIGWTCVNVQRTGKNLLPNDKYQQSYGTVVLGQTNSSYGTFLKAGTYTVSLTTSTIGTIYLNRSDGTSERVGEYSATQGSFTLNKDETLKVVYYNSRGISASDVTSFQLELGTTATAYEPYQGTSVEVALGQTVYGGTLDVVSGVLTKAPYYDSYNGEPLVGPWVSSMDKYVPGATPTTGAQVVDLGGTGTDVQLSATEVQMLLGNNVIWNDVGDMVLEYLADGPADDIDALQILLNNRYVNNGGPDEATDKEALEILLGGNTR
ncbi:MAG: hypothetical protein II605_02265, partial [Paludibacteraceae bacterium]|nr:hypothetical protein [Paludibacteraceae bacterium]